jgi:hypothetical protein
MANQENTVVGVNRHDARYAESVRKILLEIRRVHFPDYKRTDVDELPRTLESGQAHTHDEHGRQEAGQANDRPVKDKVDCKHIYTSQMSRDRRYRTCSVTARD